MAENKSWETLKEKGNALFKQNKFNEAIDYYERAIRINNSIEVLYSNKGTCEKCLKKYKEAIRDYKKALEINPKNTKNLNRLASVYIIVGNLGEAKMTELENMALMKLVGNLTKCPNCGEQNAFEEGRVDYNVRDEQNQKLSRQAAEDYAKHRCRCGFCKKDFCIGCQAIPYHLGKTCDEFKHYEKAKKFSS